MKTITNQEHDWIASAIGEGLTSLVEGVIEKDLLVTQVLHTIASADSGGIQLVFCGGTCLAKAHGLIQRMSEDIDFKLIVLAALSRSARSRCLRAAHKTLLSSLRGLAVLLALSAAARLARTASLSFVSGTKPG